MEDVLKVSHVYVSHLTLDFCDVCVRVCESKRHTFTFSFDSDSDSGFDLALKPQSASSLLRVTDWEVIMVTKAAITTSNDSYSRVS